MSSEADATFELSNAVYVDPDGNLVAVDRDTSIGAVDGTARDPVTVALDFPSADPGGEVRFLVFPRGTDEPLAVVLPVESWPNHRPRRKRVPTRIWAAAAKPHVLGAFPLRGHDGTRTRDLHRVMVAL